MRGGILIRIVGSRETYIHGHKLLDEKFLNFTEVVPKRAIIAARSAWRKRVAADAETVDL
jgi:hypothetical protein